MYNHKCLFSEILTTLFGTFCEGQGHVDSPQPCPFMSIICESKTRDGMTGAISGVSAVLCLVIKSVLQPVTPTLPALFTVVQGMWNSSVVD